jgi:hypothetical protein
MEKVSSFLGKILHKFVIKKCYQYWFMGSFIAKFDFFIDKIGLEISSVSGPKSFSIQCHIFAY